MIKGPDKKQGGDLLDDDGVLSLAELCRASRIPAEDIMNLVDYGVIEPIGRRPEQWRFSSVSIRRVRSVYRLRSDLGVNTAGAALALELLDELQYLRARLRKFESG